jgi:hypothetical protein
MTRARRLPPNTPGGTYHARQLLTGPLPPVPPLPPTEGEIQAEIIAWWRKNRPDAPISRVPMGQGRFGSRSRHSAGLSDLIAILPPDGRICAIEVKRPGAKPRANEARQRAWLDAVRASGGLVIVATSVADVEAGLADSLLTVADVALRGP